MALFTSFVNSTWHNLASLPVIEQQTVLSASDRITGDDDIERAAVLYHGGWCVMTTRRQLQRKEEKNSAALSVLGVFGEDILHDGDRMSKLVLASDSLANSSNPDEVCDMAAAQMSNSPPDNVPSATTQPEHSRDKHLFKLNSRAPAHIHTVCVMHTQGIWQQHNKAHCANLRHHVTTSTG